MGLHGQTLQKRRRSAGLEVAALEANKKPSFQRTVWACATGTLAIASGSRSTKRIKTFSRKIMVKLSEPQQLQRSLIAKKRGAVMTRTSLGVFLLLAMAHCFCALGFCSPHRVHGLCSCARTALAGWAFVSLTARMDSLKQEHFAGHDSSFYFHHT